MKLIIATYGTDGDVRPFAALSRGLLNAGHQVRLLAGSETLAGAQSLGVPTTALTGDIRGLFRQEGAFADVITRGGLHRTTAALVRISGENAESWLRTLIEAGEGCDAVLAAGLAAFVGFSAAEYLGVKAIGAGMIPITPTAAFPSPFLHPKRVPALLNRASHRFVNAMLWRAFRDKTNAARARYRLPLRRSVWTDLPMVYGVSAELLPKPADWSADVHMCGQWFTVSSSDWTPPPELGCFLATREAPVYIGFGSMPGFDLSPLLDSLIEAMNGRPALIYPGWSGIEQGRLPDNFLVIGETPHDWLFPRTAVVIHHGGSGTSHSAAAAGVPSVVVPFAGDQFFWAERLHSVGVAPVGVDRRRLSSGGFSRALDWVSAFPVKSRARILGEKMRAEDGIRKAVAALERIVEG